MKKFPQAYEEKTKFKYIGVEHLNRIKTVYNDSVSLKPLKNNRKKKPTKNISNIDSNISSIDDLFTFFFNNNNSNNNQNNDMFISFTHIKHTKSL